MSSRCRRLSKGGICPPVALPSGVLPDVVHVVMGGGLVLAAYRRPDLAMAHARCVTGTTVTSFDTRSIPGALRALIANEVLEQLPIAIKIDIEVEWEHDDDTPVVAMSVDDLDDA